MLNIQIVYGSSRKNNAVQFSEFLQFFRPVENPFFKKVERLAETGVRYARTPVSGPLLVDS
jgi:hypothetical protein